LQRIRIIDSHTGGEPTRLVIDGFPDLGSGPMAERRALLAERFDRWRTATVLEPRGSDVIVGALLAAPADPANSAGVIFFNNTGYLGMCGHGTIGLVASLAYLGRIAPGAHGVETPVGTVTTTLHEDGTVSVRNVPAHRLYRALTVDVSGYGPVTGDVAWGGNWFFLVSEPHVRVASDRIDALTDYAWAIRQTLEANGICGEGGALIDHVELFGDDEAADSRNFVLCPGRAYDRSPCGTGTSAKLACLAADGKLAPGQRWRQASIIGSCFDASYSVEGGRIVPTIRGRAHVSADATLLIEDGDPFGWGILP
jgi:4-hydroxyproline epimerase